MRVTLPDFLTPEYAATPRFRVVPAAYVLLLRAGETCPEVLLQLRSGTGYMDGHWAAGAAGHVEHRESVFQAAVREVAEELGVTVAQRNLIPLLSMHRTQGDEHEVNERVDWFFGVWEWDGEPLVSETTKAAGISWVALDALDGLAEPVVPHERLVLQHLRAHLVDGTPLPAIVEFGFTS